MNKKPAQINIKLKKAHKALVVGVVLIAIIIWAISPVLIGNGVNGYKGDLKLAAQTGLNEVNSASTSGMDKLDNIGVLSRRVKDVSRATVPTGGIFAKCNDFYKVSIEDVTWFGRQVSVGDRYICLN